MAAQTGRPYQALLDEYRRQNKSRHLTLYYDALREAELRDDLEDTELPIDASDDDESREAERMRKEKRRRNLEVLQDMKIRGADLDADHRTIFYFAFKTQSDAASCAAAVTALDYHSEVKPYSESTMFQAAVSHDMPLTELSYHETRLTMIAEKHGGEPAGRDIFRPDDPDAPRTSRR